MPDLHGRPPRIQKDQEFEQLLVHHRFRASVDVALHSPQ
jgi:hypothetical protein